MLASSPILLEAQIGSTRVLSRGDRRVWLLDACSAILWDLNKAGLGSALIIKELAERFDMENEAAHRYLNQLYDSWRKTGLLESETLAEGTVDHCFEPLRTFPAPYVFQAPPGAWRLTVAQQPIVTEVEDADLRAELAPLLAQVRDVVIPSPSDVIADHVVLSGDAARWRLIINGAELEAGVGWDAALVTTLSTLTELGCRTRERLLVLHGAGLVAPDGRCLLLSAPGGSGKSTLTMALEAEGFCLLSDDVVPIRFDGAALGLGMPACLKQGSWPILAECRPEVEQTPEVLRFDSTVRFLPPKNRPLEEAVKPDLLLFPQYRPDAAPGWALLQPEQALQGLVEAETVIRDLTQEKLTAICRWVSSMPAYAVHYPDLASAFSLVEQVLENCSEPLQ